MDAEFACTRYAINWAGMFQIPTPGLCFAALRADFSTPLLVLMHSLAKFLEAGQCTKDITVYAGAVIHSFMRTVPEIGHPGVHRRLLMEFW